ADRDHLPARGSCVGGVHLPFQRSCVGRDQLTFQGPCTGGDQLIGQDLARAGFISRSYGEPPMSKQPYPDGAPDTFTLALETQERRLREKLLAQQPPVGVSVLSMAEVESQEIAWLWERWIPGRMLTLLGGYGGDGKSTVMASLIGRWTTGGALPDGSAVEPINVLMLSAEDDVAYALRPRLDLHGADPGRV